jgi:hypothetical protein
MSFTSFSTKKETLIGIGVVVAVIVTLIQAPQLISQEKASTNPYTSIRKNAGVWNDGQAAFWDIDAIDSFRLFGAPERAKGYAPEQPIKFSHVTHVQKNKMECQYCHWSVAKTAYAAIPEVETCVGCHKYIVGGSAANLPGATEEVKKEAEVSKAEVKKILQYFEKGQAIPWAKVHVMPDHVRFNHKRHVKAGVGCQECHGQIPAMAVVERVSTMKMGWCVDCHRQKGTSIDCTTCHK